MANNQMCLVAAGQQCKHLHTKATTPRQQDHHLSPTPTTTFLSPPPYPHALTPHLTHPHPLKRYLPPSPLKMPPHPLTPSHPQAPPHPLKPHLIPHTPPHTLKPHPSHTLDDQFNKGLDAGLSNSLVFDQVLQGHSCLHLHWELLVPSEAVHHLVGNK